MRLSCVSWDPCRCFTTGICSHSHLSSSFTRSAAFKLQLHFSSVQFSVSANASKLSTQFWGRNLIQLWCSVNFNWVFHFLRLNKITTSILVELARVHLKISDSVNLINRTLSLSIMFSFGIGFLKICIFIFMLLQSSTRFWKKFYLYGILNCYFNCFLLMLMIIIFRACESTIYQNNETFNILFKLLMNTRHESSDFDKKASFRFLMFLKSGKFSTFSPSASCLSVCL